MSNQASPYLRLNLGSNGGQFEFQGVADAAEFAERELGFWAFLNSVEQLEVPPEFKAVATGVFKRLLRLHSQAQAAVRGEVQAADLERQFQNVFYEPLDALESTGKVPISRSAKAQYLVQSFERDGPLGALAAIAIETKAAQATNYLNNTAAFRGVVAYLNFLNGQSDFVAEAVRRAAEVDAKEYRRRLEEDKYSFEALKQNSQTLIDKSERLLSIGPGWARHRWKRKSAEIQKELDGHVKAFKQTEDTYKTFMKLKAPATYWESKAEGHDVRTLIFAAIATVWALGAGWVLWFQLGDIFQQALQLASQTDPSGRSSQLNSSVLFILIGQGLILSTIVFWVARVLVRLFLSELHLAMDARERTTMVQCYLALTEEGEVDEGNLNIVLQALFRPTQDGIVKDDASADLTPSGVLSRMLNPK